VKFGTMKLAFISVFFFFVLSSASAQSIFAGRNRSGGGGININFKGQANGQAGGVIDKAAANNAANANANAKNNTAANAANAGGAAGNNGTGTGTAANSGDPQTSTTLDPQVISTGFEQNGQNPPVAGQTASLTSSNNFINFCLLTLKQFPLTNGQQVKGGSCNSVVAGLIPPSSKMVSTLLLFPQDGDVVEANKDFTISLISTNIKLGVFTNADKNYLSAPQTLDPATSEIVGHTHVTVQPITSQTTPPDPTKFTFFKGINTPANGQGQVSADVAGGLPPGDYRLCTMTSAANHQPVIMPIAQRGSQDDCVRFKVQVGAASNGTAGNGAAAGGADATATGGVNATAAGNAANKGAAGGAGNKAAAGGAANKAAAGGKGKRWFSMEIV